MKLSEAILKGCTMSEPATSRLYVKGENGPMTCALGAAYLGSRGLEAVKDLFGSNGGGICASNFVGDGGEFPILKTLAELRLPLHWHHHFEEVEAEELEDIEQEFEADPDEWTAVMGSCDLEELIIELNDRYHVSREDIANFLARYGL